MLSSTSISSEAVPSSVTASPTPYNTNSPNPRQGITDHTICSLADALEDQATA
jgi:hypothetical protein